MDRPLSNLDLDQATSLAKEIIDAIELGTTSLSGSFLKGYRLARLLNQQEMEQVFRYEIDGYPLTGGTIPQPAWRCCEIAGRVSIAVDKSNPDGRLTAFAESVERLETQLDLTKKRIEAARDPNVSITSANPNQYLWPPEGNKNERDSLHRLALDTADKIASRRGFLLRYATAWYYELRFSGVASDVFQSVRRRVDSEIQSLLPGAAKKFVSVHDNLRSDNSEDWSNAVHSCRRILQDLADAVFPTQNEPRVNVQGKKTGQIWLGPDQFINRLMCFAEDKSKSARFSDVVGSHLRYMGDRLDAVFLAAQKGSHSEITSRSEAERYVVYTYMLVGDILSLR